VDRYRSVIEPAGIDLEDYRKSPVLLWEHGRCPTRGRLPVGRALWIKRQGNKLVLRGQFGKDDYSMALWEMYRDGICRGWSIFAIPDPKQASPPTRAEIRSRPELADCDIMFRACALGEVSCVSVPGNPETLTLLAERGIWYPQERAGAAPVGPPAPGPALPSAPVAASADDEDDDEEEDAIEECGPDGKPMKAKGKAKGKMPAAIAEAGAAPPGPPAPSAPLPMPAASASAAERSLPPLEGVTFREIHAEMLQLLRRNIADQRQMIKDVADLLKGRV
jgi:hypothetical protein